jgi:hypothetical protein
MRAVRYKTGEQIATRGSLNCGILVRNAFKGQLCAPIENPGRGGRGRLLSCLGRTFERTSS